MQIIAGRKVPDDSRTSVSIGTRFVVIQTKGRVTFVKNSRQRVIFEARKHSSCRQIRAEKMLGQRKCPKVVVQVFPDSSVERRVMSVDGEIANEACDLVSDLIPHWSRRYLTRADSVKPCEFEPAITLRGLNEGREFVIHLPVFHFHQCHLAGGDSATAISSFEIDGNKRRLRQEVQVGNVFRIKRPARPYSLFTQCQHPPFSDHQDVESAGKHHVRESKSVPSASDIPLSNRCTSQSATAVFRSIWAP